ncbi:MFS transporter [Nocardia sp. NPDC004068]|uniref:MFS transporter n=1 Tax=Nocardia sp. NPDC004068 TaxID=3364303 RepID=UPI0036845D9F
MKSTPRVAERPDGFDRKLLLPMVLGSILNPINTSILAVSLVPIGIALGAPPAQTAWLVSGLYVATAVGQPAMGRLIDLFGPRPLFLAGTALTGLGGVLGVTAPSLWVLVLARVILGLGTCAGYPAAMHLLRSEADRTGRPAQTSVMTVLAVANQTIAVIGPTLGGLLIHLGGWRTTFAINIPLAVACLVVGALWLPKSRVAPRTARAGLDVPGMVLFAGMLVALLLFLMKPQAAQWYSAALAVVLLVALAGWEVRAASPFLDVRALASSVPLLVTYLRSLLTATVAYCFLYGFTQWLEEGRGLNPTVAGLMLLPMSLTAIGVSAITGRRNRIRSKLLVGSAGQLVACSLLLFMTPATPLWLPLVAALVMGVPQGLNTLAIQNAVYHQADPARTASSAGLQRTFFYLGAIGSAAASGSFLTPGSGAAGLHHLAWFMVAAAALFFLVTVVDRSLRHLAVD